MMISINLLPPEMRKRERTPIAIFLPIIVGLVCVLSGGAATAYVHFAWLTEAVNDRRALEAELKQRKVNLVYEEKLLAEETEYKKRGDTIRDIAVSRMLMTRKLDEICDLVVDGDKTGSYFIHLTDLKTAPPKASTGKARGGDAMKPGGEFTMRGFALADKDPLQTYNNFHGTVKNSEFFKECISLENPDGKTQDFSDEKTPKKAWTIDLVMSMMHPVEVAKAKAKAKGQADTQVADKGAKPKVSPR